MVQDIVLPVVGGEGSVAQALWERLVDIQEWRVEWEEWGVPCAVTIPERPQGPVRACRHRAGVVALPPLTEAMLLRPALWSISAVGERGIASNVN